MTKFFAAPVVVVAPDSFKGSLRASEAAEAIAAGVRRARPEADVRLCPMADGGEGTLDAVLTRGGKRRILQVTGAAGASRAAAVGLLDDGSAMIESAEIVGITDPDGMAAPVSARSTRGIGEAIRLLLDEGVRHFLVALGGSSTNDGGAGLLAALGVRLTDANGALIEPTPRGLARLEQVDTSALDPRLREATFLAMSDVNNPLAGPQGATAVFGPQKGVHAGEVEQIDAILDRFGAQIEASMNRTARNAVGAGAAGGLGFALQVLGATVAPGAEVVARHIGLGRALEGAHWLITGEGRSDRQTLYGKAPYIACRHARAVDVPATLLSGSVDATALAQLGEHFTGCFSPAPGPLTLEAAMRDTALLLANAAEQLTRLRFG